MDPMSEDNKAELVPPSEVEAEVRATKSKSAKEPKASGKESPSVSDYLAGESKLFPGKPLPHLPQDLIGGAIPHIPGSEDESVWNAASQACSTEKVHYTYTVEGGRVWYLACPSASLASTPSSWCPLAAALPGNSEYWDRETVYLYEQEGQASALRWDPETGRMQVFLGASRTILPRVQSMESNFVTINPEKATIVPWRNKMLRTEKLSRAVVRMLIISGLLVNLIAALILVMNLISIGYIERDLEDIQNKTNEAAQQLVEKAASVMQSDTIRHMVRVQELLDGIALSNGYLVRYEAVGNRTEWSAIVPEALAPAAIKELTLNQVIGTRVSSSAPEVKGPEEGGNVRIEGKK